MTLNLELDDALAATIEAAAKARGVSTRDFVRQAVQHVAALPVTSRCAPFFQKVHDFGAHIETPWTVLAELESEEYVRKYARK